MTTLAVFDFDGTLFRSPDRPDWWGRYPWIVDNSSLGRPCVPDKPGSDWWVSPVVNDAKQSISDPDILAIVCTGRAQSVGGFRYRIPELLKGKGLNFDLVYLNPGQDTKAFKQQIISKLTRQFPEIDTVHIWENHPQHLPSFIKHVEKLGLQGVPHFVRSTPHPTTCTQEQQEALTQSGHSDWVKRAAQKVAAKWIENILI